MTNTTAKKPTGLSYYLLTGANVLFGGGDWIQVFSPQIRDESALLHLSQLVIQEIIELIVLPGAKAEDAAVQFLNG